MPPDAVKQTSIIFGVAGVVAILAGAFGLLRTSFAVVLFVIGLTLAAIVMMSGKSKD